MYKQKNIEKISLLLLIFIVSSLSFGFWGDDINGKKTKQPIAKVSGIKETGKNGDAYRMYINNINLPLNRKGIIAAVNIPDDDPNISGEGGKFGNIVFLFSSGFFLSGYRNGELWANANASASLVEDYIHGTVADGSGDARAVMYVLRADEQAFGKGWQDWKDAVALGADFYDGDGDGIYNPVDINGNGKWDPDEDSPDILGDETVWCVYNDGVAAPARRWSVDPVGIEVRQTVFAFASAGPLGNIVFVRYRFKYVGLNKPDDPDKLTDVLFSVWSDPDLGDHTDDHIGCDTSRDAGYVYNTGPDAKYGNQPPCFLTDFFSGPVAYIAGETYTDVNGNGKWDDDVDIPLDTAYSSRGQLIGVKPFPGAKNLKLATFMIYINGDPDLNDPDTKFHARNYMMAKTREGGDIDPCSFAYGEVVGGVDCAQINNRFLFSGNPVTRVGWLNNTPSDGRQMQNIGPFELEKGVENEVVVAYVVGQGSNALNSVNVAKNFSDGAQFIFDNNFAAPTPPAIIQPTVLTGENFIDLIWDTKDQFGYKNTTTAYDLRFKGYKIHSYLTATTENTVNNVQNKFEIAHFAKDDFIWNIYKEDPITGYNNLLYPRADSLNRLDSAIFSDPITGKMRYRIRKNPIDGKDLVKGRPYYFSIVSYGLNYNALNKIPSSTNDYSLSASDFVGEVENIPRIFTVTLGENIYNPPVDTLASTQAGGYSKGRVLYDVTDKKSLTGDKYKISFFKDKSTNASYKMFWKLENVSKSPVTTLLDSMTTYYSTLSDVFNNPGIGANVTDGFVVKVLQVTPAVGTLTATTATPIFDKDKILLHYLATDASGATQLSPIGSTLSGLNNNYLTADRLRRVEIRFGTTSKAYRYLQGYIGSALTRRNSVRYAENISASDTVNLGPVGNWDTSKDRANGFVDVPFSAWIKDYVTGEEYQLATAFIERQAYKPDGIWNPDTTNMGTNGEYILVFDTPYDPTGSNKVYKGGEYIKAGLAQYADLRGKGQYQIPADANLTDEEKRMAESPYFNTLYAIGLPTLQQTTPVFSPGDVVAATVGAYPYTDKDEFVFSTTPGGALSQEEEKSLFNRVNVFPNPLYGFNTLGSFSGQDSDEPFVTFSNLPEQVTIKIYSLDGVLVRTLDQSQKSSTSSPFLRWDLQNEYGLRVASGLYLAIVSSPIYGDKVLKFSIIMPQKQLQKY